MIRPAALLLLLVCPAVRVAAGQATNAERMGALAVRCVVELTGGLDPIRVEGGERLPFVRSALVATWQASGVSVYGAGGEPDRPAATVRISVEDAGVTYDRADGPGLSRTVRLALFVAVTASDGRILHEDTCSTSETDLVPADRRDAIEDATYRETVGTGPPESFFRRILEPVVITAATAVGVFLFFSLRSRRADDGG